MELPWNLVLYIDVLLDGEIYNIYAIAVPEVLIDADVILEQLFLNNGYIFFS